MTFAPFPFPCLPQFFLFSISRFSDTGKLVYCVSRKQRCGSDHPCYLFSNSTLSFSRWMDQILKIQVNYLFTRLRRFCFVLCPLASSSQLCICFTDCYWVCTGKASQPVCGSSRHQAVITVIQNKRFPNLWKRDYIWLICVCATIFGLKSNMAETRCAEFYNCWLQLRSSWAADKRMGCDYGPLWATNRHLLNVINRSPQVIEVLDCQKEHFLLSG